MGFTCRIQSETMEDFLFGTEELIVQMYKKIQNLENMLGRANIVLPVGHIPYLRRLHIHLMLVSMNAITESDAMWFRHLSDLFMSEINMYTNAVRYAMSASYNWENHEQIVLTDEDLFMADYMYKDNQKKNSKSKKN